MLNNLDLPKRLSLRLEANYQCFIPQALFCDRFVHKFLIFDNFLNQGCFQQQLQPLSQVSD